MEEEIESDFDNLDDEDLFGKNMDQEDKVMQKNGNKEENGTSEVKIEKDGLILQEIEGGEDEGDYYQNQS